MAAKSNKETKTGGKQAGFTPVVWVNYDLTTEDKVRLSDGKLQAQLRGLAITDIVTEGFKFSLSPDAKNACYVASLTDKSPDSAFQNHCLTGRGSTAADAIISLLYRHVVLANGDWTFFRSASTDGTDIYF